MCQHHPQWLLLQNPPICPRHLLPNLAPRLAPSGLCILSQLSPQMGYKLRGKVLCSASVIVILVKRPYHSLSQPDFSFLGNKVQCIWKLFVQTCTTDILSGNLSITIFHQDVEQENYWILLFASFWPANSKTEHYLHAKYLHLNHAYVLYKHPCMPCLAQLCITEL